MKVFEFSELENWAILDDVFEERAAILEYDAGYTRHEAENRAAQAYGFSNKAELKSYVQLLKAQETV